MTFTPRQLDCLHVIRDYRHECGYAPTLQEIADAMGIKKSATFELVQALKAKQAISQTRIGRSIEILIDLPKPKVNLRWPVIGTIAKQGITLKGNV